MTLETRPIIYGQGPTYVDNIQSETGEVKPIVSRPIDVRATFVDGRELPPLVAPQDFKVPAAATTSPKPPYELTGQDIYRNFIANFIHPIAKHMLVAKGILKPFIPNHDSSPHIFLRQNYSPYRPGIAEAILLFEKKEPELYQSLLQGNMLTVLLDFSDEKIQPEYHNFAKEVQGTLRRRATAVERLNQRRNSYAPKTVEKRFNKALDDINITAFLKIETLLAEVDLTLPIEDQYNSPQRRNTALT